MSPDELVVANEQRKALAARFPADLERRFEGRGGRTFTYVPDESVMDRLDDVFGVGGWSIGVDPMGDRCVRVTLRALGVEYQDFGYSNNAESAEPLKEASGDGLRRCARYIGIARYLYAGDVRPQPVQNGPGRPEPARVAPASAYLSTMTPPVPEEWDGMGPPPIAKDTDRTAESWPAPASPGDYCDEHQQPWLGEVNDLYHRVPRGGYHRHPMNTPRAAVR